MPRIARKKTSLEYRPDARIGFRPRSSAAGLAGAGLVERVALALLPGVARFLDGLQPARPGRLALEALRLDHVVPELAAAELAVVAEQQHFQPGVVGDVARGRAFVAADRHGEPPAE